LGAVFRRSTVSNSQIFSKCFLFIYIGRAGLDRWLQFHIVEATDVLDCLSPPENRL
jgi:hypothetical protein